MLHKAGMWSKSHSREQQVVWNIHTSNDCRVKIAVDMHVHVHYIDFLLTLSRLVSTSVSQEESAITQIRYVTEVAQDYREKNTRTGIQN